MKSFILACFCLVTIVLAQDVTLIPVSGTVFGLAGNGTIYYQQNDAFSFNGLNIQNPVDVSISYQQNSFNFDASICFNYNGLPINGASLESSCPSGGYGTASNTTSYLVAPPGSQIKKTQYSSLKSNFIGNKMALATTLPEGTTTETTVAKIYIKPQNNGKFVVTVPDSIDQVSFYVGFNSYVCSNSSYYPINGTCVQIPAAQVGENVLTGIPSEGWKYLQYSVKAFGTNITSFNVTINGTKDDVKLYVQSGYYPTEDWFINTIDDDNDGTLTAVIANPASTYIDSTETFFLGVYNGDKDPQTVNLTITPDATCNAAQFGYRCSHSLTNSSSPVTGYSILSATLAQNATGVNLTQSYDYTDKDTYSDYDYAYFILNDYPVPGVTPGYETLTYPYYIRVSVSNNDVSEYAPGFFAKLGGFPSAQSAAYNVSTATDVAHQIIIEVTETTPAPTSPPDANTWVFAVQLKNDFSIWVGINCANDCDNNDHGECMCNDVPCANVTGNNMDYSAYYTLPNSTLDSAGACTCSDDDYDYSYDCSQKNNGNAALYIVLIAVGGMIVLAVAIGVPIYCYISNKKATRYDRM